MRPTLRMMSWVLAFVAVGAATAAWFTPRPELDARQAAQTAAGALAHVGYTATVTAPVVRDARETADGTTVGVWDVKLQVRGDPIEAAVLVDAGQLVYIDDRIGADRTDRLLSDEEFEAIGEYRNDVVRHDWVLRNLVAGVAALCIAPVALVIAKRSDTLRSRP